MKITRSEAITMAVRRHFRLRPLPIGMVSVENVGPDVQSSIRKHFSRVCGQYEVVDDSRAGEPGENNGPYMVAGQVYDGHSLRI